MSRIKRQKRGVRPPVPTSGPVWRGPSAPAPSSLALAEASVKTVRPRSVARRAILLFRWADHQAPALLGGAAWRGLLLLARVPWHRMPDGRFDGASVGALARHLLGRYPIAPGLLAVFDTPTQFHGRPGNDSRAAAVAACLGRGGRYEDVAALLPGELTRKVFACLVNSQEDVPFVTTLRAAQVRAHGGPAWLAGALAAHRRFAEVGVGADLPTIAWLSRQADLVPEALGEVLDFLAARPILLARRTFSSVRRLCEAWHDERIASVHNDPRPLGPSVLGPLDGVPPAGWRAEELRSPLELAREGARMHHCVATYIPYVRAGSTSIWSLTDERRRLTLEVRNALRAIVQIRGPCNRRPDGDELSAIRAWASANELVVAEGAAR